MFGYSLDGPNGILTGVLCFVLTLHSAVECSKNASTGEMDTEKLIPNNFVIDDTIFN